MEQLVGFVEPGVEHKVYLLKRFLYSLKQSPRAWYSRITQFLCHGNLWQNVEDYNLYYSHQGIDIVILLLYVDDLFLTCSNSLLVDQLKA